MLFFDSFKIQWEKEKDVYLPNLIDIYNSIFLLTTLMSGIVNFWDSFIAIHEVSLVFYREVSKVVVNFPE